MEERSRISMATEDGVSAAQRVQLSEKAFSFHGGLKVHTLSVVAKGHLGLTKTNCVLSGAGAVVLLELSLFDILHGGAPKC